MQDLKPILIFLFLSSIFFAGRQKEETNKLINNARNIDALSTGTLLYIVRE
jgi:hypothetical protein